MEYETKNLTTESNVSNSHALPPTTGATGPHSATGIPEKWVDALLLRFSALWPRAWADAIGNLDYRLLAHEWSQGLAGLTGADIKRGLDHARDHMSWPPSIAEFRKACLGGANAEQLAYAARAAEVVPMLASKTRAETLQEGAESAARVRQVVSDQGAKRTLQDAIQGLWTREREETFQQHCRVVRANYPTPGWLNEILEAFREDKAT